MSALHGLLPPDRVIDSYDLSLASLRQVEREQWSYRLRLQLAERFAGLVVELVVYAGSLYVGAIKAACCPRPPASTLAAPASRLATWRLEQLHAPLEGLGVGERLAWFRARRPAAAAASCRRCGLLRTLDAKRRCATCARRALEREQERLDAIKRRAADAEGRRTARVQQTLKREAAARRSDESSRRAMEEEASRQRSRAAAGLLVGVPVRCGGWVAADGELRSALDHAALERAAFAARMSRSGANGSEGK